MMMNAVKNPGMVWMHGGGWKSGNGQLDRSGFLNNGIVAMTVQVGLKLSSDETPTSFFFAIYCFIKVYRKRSVGNFRNQTQLKM